ncbi:hypothetical protein JTB14_038014 [Gonioctena quinquepunctata]|nr:hypothetical protein JTB14_038014 [Gonioctena quinquepunctata]
MLTSAPIVEPSNKFAALADSDMDQEQKQDNSKQNEPPPIFIWDNKTWPITCQYLKNHGISSEKNLNTKDGVKMIFSSTEKYDECKKILDKVQYHTFQKSGNKEIRAIFKGVAEDLDSTSIANELIGRGFNPRIVARFKTLKTEKENRTML